MNGIESDRSAKWVLGYEATNLEEARELVEVAFERAGMPAPQTWRELWRVTDGELAPWEYADVELGGRMLTVCISNSGVVAFNDNPFAPGGQQLNVTLSRVERSRHAWYVGQDHRESPAVTGQHELSRGAHVLIRCDEENMGFLKTLGVDGQFRRDLGGVDAMVAEETLERIREFGADFRVAPFDLAVSSPSNAAGVSLQQAYERLHDILSDCIEGGRLREADLPDDYQALVEALATCNAATNTAPVGVPGSANIVIGVQGGIVQGITSNLPVNFVVYDYDTQGEPSVEVPSLDNTGPIEVLNTEIRDSVVDPMAINRIFTFFEDEPGLGL